MRRPGYVQGVITDQEYSSDMLFLSSFLFGDIGTELKLMHCRVA